MRSGEKTGAPVVKAQCSANRIFLKNVLAQNSALCYNGENKREAFGMKFRDTPMQNLVSIREKEVCAKVREMLLEGESLVAAYKTVRDQVVFTTHRIFMVDMQGLTGTRQEIFVLPYRKIQHFGILTTGFGDPVPSSRLTVCYADQHEMEFGFLADDENLIRVSRAISSCIL